MHVQAHIAIRPAARGVFHVRSRMRNQFTPNPNRSHRPPNTVRFGHSERQLHYRCQRRAARINRCAVPLCRLFMKIESVYLLIKSFCRTDPGRLAAQRLLGAKYWLIIANSNLEINIVRAPHARWRTWIPQYLIVS